MGTSQGNKLIKLVERNVDFYIYICFYMRFHLEIHLALKGSTFFLIYVYEYVNGMQLTNCSW